MSNETPRVPAMTERQVESARRLRDQGQTYREIGRRMGYSAEHVRQRLMEAAKLKTEQEVAP